MGLRVTNKGKSNVPPLEGGVYMGICVGVVDFGEQKNERFKKYQDKLLVVWEIVNEFVEVKGERKPRWLSKEYTKSLNDKANLGQALLAWRGQAFTQEELEGFDMSQMIGESCQLQVLKEEKEGVLRNKVQGVFGLPKGVQLTPPISETFVFDMEAPDADEVFEKLPLWMRERIERSPSWAKLHAGKEEMDMDVPMPGSGTAQAPEKAQTEAAAGPGF